MDLREFIARGERAIIEALGAGALRETVPGGRARARIAHRRPTHWLRDPATGLLVPDPRSYVDVDEPSEVCNVITNVGRQFLHKQGYGTSGLGTNGLNFIALSNDALTETATSTVLSSEITANGLARAQGTVTLPTGSGNQTTIDHLFTCATAAQSAQKAALLDAASAGNMNHALSFPQRPLQVGDTLQITYTITLG